MEQLFILLNQIIEKLDRIAERLGNPLPSATRLTFFEWLEEWFSTYKVPVLVDSGYDLRHTIDKHVKPNIENKALSDYSSLDITKALNAIKSSRMRQIVYQVYDQCFSQAVKAEIIQNSPVDRIDRPKHIYEHGRSLSRSEEDEFLEKSKAHHLRYLWRYYLLSGSRPGEPFKLKWSDIVDGSLHIRGTKTEGSDRVIPIGEKLRILLAEIPRKSDYVFPTNYNAAYRCFKNFRKKLTFDMTLKDLRHTFGTRCLEAGVSMKTLQKWLGHSSFKTTADIYSHVLTDFERSEIEKL